VTPTKLRRQGLDLLQECHFGIQQIESWRGQPFTGQTPIPTIRICAGSVRFAPGISPNRQKPPFMYGCYLRSRGATYILIMPSTFWGITGLWLLKPILNIPASMQHSQYFDKSISRISVSPTDCAATFKSEEFQEFCKENGIVHLTGAPYHPATNGAAERLVQTFKQA